ncbi:MAG: hypothetical protein H6738_24740 [Alphaproteobacteria bacterium]|nr:hypothetical protein [Alphaproteobacteria bacterium]MCB9700018.1 hypothetical protein [Alphaproteobacteria bacterium]
MTPDAAAPSPAVEVALHLDVKTFLVTSFPSPWITAPDIPAELEPFLPEGYDPQDLLDASGLGANPTGTGIGAARLRLDLSRGPFSFQAHHELAVLTSATSASPLGGGASAGVGLSAPELVDLTWTADTGDALTVRGRTDRLVLAWSPRGARVALGRQPVSFGTGYVFTPMDVVNPFSAATIDTEYKPGIDAARVDVFLGATGKLTAVGAWAGPLPPTHPDAEPVDLTDVVLAAAGQGTVGLTDLVGLAAVVRGDLVGGAGVISSIGVVGLHGEATVTLPDEEAVEQDPFVRAVVGADGRPTTTTSLAAEVYVQTNGAADPADYLDFATGPRFSRGELWTMGQLYAALSVNQEITPLVTGSAAVIANLLDPSALVAPALSVSVSDDATVGIGGFLSIGARPDEVPLGLDPTTFALVPPTQDALAASVNSEFGLYPHTVFMNMRVWF